jgi:tetratricopeptide (TPR) repeat protein
MGGTLQQKFDRAAQLAGASDWEAAVPLYLEAAREFGAAGDVAGVGRCYYNLGRYARDVLQDYQSAEAAYLTALANFANAEEAHLAQIYTSLMLNAEAAGWQAKAAAFGQLALAEADATKDSDDLLTANNNLAFFYADGDEPDRAVPYAEAALRHATRMNQAKEIELGEYTLGYALDRSGSYAEAEQHYRLSLRRSDAIEQILDSAVCAHTLAKLVACDPARHDEAVALFDDAIRRFAAIGDEEGLAEAKKERDSLAV